jgi:3-deoxy-7-phosphoheptulonate synthase
MANQPSRPPGALPRPAPVPEVKLPSFVVEDDDLEDPTCAAVLLDQVAASAKSRPYLVGIAGAMVGQMYALEGDRITIGRSRTADLCVEDSGISRNHAVIVRSEAGYEIEDLKSVNGTRVNGRNVEQRRRLSNEDKIWLGPNVVLKFTLQDEIDEQYHRMVSDAISVSGQAPPSLRRRTDWSVDSWRTKPIAQAIEYEDELELDFVKGKLRKLPPLVTSWEIEELKQLIAEAQEGKRFLLQGGDCAETLADCESNVLTNKLKILIQMSLVLIRGARLPVIRVGRFAGQYAKPRSKATETRNGIELPSYFGDLVNRAEFTAEARRPDPHLLIAGYLHAAMTLNYIRALGSGNFSDLRRPEYFDLQVFERAELPAQLREEYRRMCREIQEGLNFLQAMGDRQLDDLMKVSFYTSHEALNLDYESAQTRSVPRHDGYYDLTTHLPWIGERTRALDGAHVEFFRGIENPIGVKLGPTTTADDALKLCDALNPDNKPGKLVLVTRMGVKAVSDVLPHIVETVEAEGLRVLWVCDPMHGNTVVAESGVKTRNFEDILREVEISMAIHRTCGSYLGGVHFELTGEDVTECVGGGVTEADLSKNYATACDPRLNYRQAIEMAFCIARCLMNNPRLSSMLPGAP